MDRLTLLTVHAHPDDESSKGAATVARYHAEGVHTVLVTATGGEEGDILNPAMDRPGVRERMTEIRREELAAAARVIGYDEVVPLGYRDSGMADSAANADPRSFAQAPLVEAVGRLVAIIRRAQPQVLVTYSRDQSGYPHPDHIRVNEICEVAFDAAADPDRYAEAGEPWQPSKMYATAWSTRQMLATHGKFLELGLESPYEDDRFAERLQRAKDAEPEPATIVDVGGYTHVRREALRAHATQVDPTSRHWFGLPDDVAETVYPYDEYVLLRDLTGSDPEADDLFAGVRSVARR